MSEAGSHIGRLDTAGLPRFGGATLAFLGVLLVLWIGVGLMGMVENLGLPIASELVFLAIPIVAFVALLAWFNERIWALTAVLGHVSMALASGYEGVGIGEGLFAVAALGGLLIWFFKEILIHRNRLIETGFDALLFGFFWVSTATSIVMCAVHDGEALLFVKDWLIPFDTLLYFPLRKLMRNRDDLVKLFIIFTIVALVSGIMGIVTYRQRLAQAVFQWQVEGSRVFTNEPTAMAFVIFCSTAFAYARSRRVAVFSFLGFIAAMAFLLISFSRGAIAAGALGVIVIMVIAPFRQGRRVAVSTVGGIIGCVAIVFIAFPGIANSIAVSVQKRLSTVASAATDVSFNLRVNESNVLLKDYIAKSPVLGYGYGVTYQLYDPLSRTNREFLFIHNGYVRPLFKFGIPLSILMYLILVYPFVRLMYQAPRREHRFEHALMVGAVGLLVATLVLQYVSDQFSTYPGALNIALCWAVFDYVNRRAARDREEARLMPGVMAWQLGPRAGG